MSRTKTITKPLLIVSHDASATGGPVLLLHLLRWLRSETEFDFRVALKKSGVLAEQFSQLAPVVVFGGAARSLPARIVDRVMPNGARNYLIANRFRRALGTDRYALIYSNTLVNGEVLRLVRDQQCPLISHVHELDYMLWRLASPADLAYSLERTSHFIAGSEAVARNLVDNHGVGAARIDVVHEFIPLDELDSDRLGGPARIIRSELGIPEDAIVAGAAGTLDWRKGYDLFIMMAIEALRAQCPRELHFVWIGGTGIRHIPVEIGHDLRKLGLEQRIHFAGHRSNYLDYIAAFDMLCLTSREDCFPLVMLESAALGKPVLCFAESGGSPEFVQADAGFVVPYLDTRAMAARVLELAANCALRRDLGRRGASRVRERHNVAVIAPRIADIIRRTIGAQSLEA
jgi:glycosyltransferase involved in cell wall biosynthesis